MRAITAAPRLHTPKRIASMPTLPIATIAREIQHFRTMIGIRRDRAKRSSISMDGTRIGLRSKILFTSRCPAGNRLYGNGSNINVNGFIGMRFRGAKSVCGPCILRQRCLKTPETTQTKQVTIFIGRSEENKQSPIERMRRKFDTLFGRFIYNKRIAIVEPVFGNLKNKGMDRFTLRGKQKVNTQWQLFSLVHNIEKIAHVGAV